MPSNAPRVMISVHRGPSRFGGVRDVDLALVGDHDELDERSGKDADELGGLEPRAARPGRRGSSGSSDRPPLGCRVGQPLRFLDLLHAHHRRPVDLVADGVVDLAVCARCNGSGCT
jgi:hypothetical protein